MAQRYPVPQVLVTYPETRMRCPSNKQQHRGTHLSLCVIGQDKTTSGEHVNKILHIRTPFGCFGKRARQEERGIPDSLQP